MSAILELDEDRDIEFVREVLPDRYEVIDGQIVEMPPMSVLSNAVSNRLHVEIGYYARQKKLGEAFMESLIHLPEPVDRNRRPDLCFVSYERWPATRPYSSGNAREVVPDLAIEVVSPSDLAEDNHEKIVEYFKCGVRQVWVVYPELRLVYIFDSLTQVRGLTADDIIEGSPCLPGLQLRISDVIPAMETK